VDLPQPHALLEGNMGDGKVIKGQAHAKSWGKNKKNRKNKISKKQGEHGFTVYLNCAGMSPGSYLAASKNSILNLKVTLKVLILLAET
jgi:hypothetical protein